MVGGFVGDIVVEVTLAVQDGTVAVVAVDAGRVSVDTLALVEADDVDVAGTVGIVGNVEVAAVAVVVAAGAVSKGS